MIDTIVGVDCATQDRKVGLALARRYDAGWRLVEALSCSRTRPVLGTLEGWLKEYPALLLAMDAPLGWPSSLPRALSTHQAGEEPSFGPDALFRRETDRFIAKEFKKTPLDVGADRIARTAYWALALLSSLRRVSGASIPLLWDPTTARGPGVIEVYPAATLRAHGQSLAGYRQREGAELRRRLAAFVGRELHATITNEAEAIGIDGLDAAVCAVAGRDFLCGVAAAPLDLPLARKEGWIWARHPTPPTTGEIGMAASGSNSR